MIKNCIVSNVYSPDTVENIFKNLKENYPDYFTSPIMYSDLIDNKAMAIHPAYTLVKRTDDSTQGNNHSKCALTGISTYYVTYDNFKNIIKRITIDNLIPCDFLIEFGTFKSVHDQNRYLFYPKGSAEDKRRKDLTRHIYARYRIDEKGYMYTSIFSIKYDLDRNIADVKFDTWGRQTKDTNCLDALNLIQAMSSRELFKVDDLCVLSGSDTNRISEYLNTISEKYDIPEVGYIRSILKNSLKTDRLG